MSEDKLKSIYYNPKQGFLSLTKLWKKVKEENIPLSYNDVRKWLEQQKTYQLNKQVKKPKEFRNVYADHPLQSVQIDIMIYDTITNTSLFHRCLFSLCCLSPLTNMIMGTIMDKLKEIFGRRARILS